ncbi:hypothetical protein BGX28_002657 [Mortierella sp. GBA30]|nr:hypothetical protein BGX28_002657 [Mortierella sp. GBA30]
MSANSPQSLLWEAFRADPSAGDLYLADVHIVFLPTGAGAASEPYVRDFYQSGGYSHPKKLAVEETVIHRTIGESSAADEVEVTVKFVSGAGGWLLPGIEPYHLEDLTITFPLVICASFQDDKIASVRYMWDNASVLKMVRLIGSRHSWPIVADTQVDALRNPTRFRLNPFGNATSNTAGSRPQTGISKIFATTPPISPPQSAASQAGQPPKKGHPALTSTVFSHLKNPPSDTGSGSRPLSPSSPTSEGSSGNNNSPQPTKKGHPALTSTLFNHLPRTNPNRSYEDKEQSNGRSNQQQQQEETTAMNSSEPVVKKKGHPALTSTLFNHLKEQSQEGSQKPTNHSSSPRQEQPEKEEERGAGWRADYVKPKGHPALTSTIFSQPPPAPSPAVTRPYKKTSHNIFGPPTTETTTTTESAKTAVVAEHIVEEPQVQTDVQEEEKQEEEESSYNLEPSTIEAELEKQTEEHEDQAEQEQEHLQKEVQALEELAIQEKKTDSGPVSPSPASPTSASARKIHPNYRTSFTIGGPR